MQRKTHGIVRQLTRRYKLPFAVDRPGGTITILVRRTGVEPSLGLLPFLPIWAFTALRWLVSDRSWSVELAAGSSSANLLRRFEHHRFGTRNEADAAATDSIERAKRGEYDHVIT